MAKENSAVIEGARAENYLSALRLAFVHNEAVMICDEAKAGKFLHHILRFQQEIVREIARTEKTIRKSPMRSPDDKR